MDKRELRSICKAKRESIAEREEKSRIIADKLLSLPEYKAAGRVFCYKSFGSEVMTGRIIGAAIAGGKSVFVPAIRDGEMALIGVNTASEYAVSAFGISEPVGEIYTGSVDLTVVPCLAADAEFYRLGYGGGHYDRFLSGGSAGVAACVLFAELLTDKLPHEEHDRKTDIIITQDGIIRRPAL